MTAYQITSMMEGVVQRGTATVVMQVGKPIAGKTGTTNDEKDAWFVGFSPDLVVGVFIGYDKPRPMGKGHDRRRARRADLHRVHERGAEGRAAEGVPGAARHRAHPDRPPHRPARPGSGEGVILEAFKPGTAPPDTLIGFSDQMGVPTQRPEQRSRAVADAPSNTDWQLANPPPFIWAPRAAPPAARALAKQNRSVPAQYRMLPNGVILKVR